ncbi:MAG: TldD/PmbA family protein [Bacilli bacterium]|nr:TldD/PmbA family protein [Bacilli bacterium]
MKYDLFFQLAKEAGIEECELYIRQSYALSISLFHDEIDNYSSNNGYAIIARGKVNGKLGVASADVWNKEKAAYLVKEIKENALVIENEDPVVIFPGSPKYKKVNTFNKDLEKVSIEEKIAKLHQLEKEIRAFDERIVEVSGVEYAEGRDEVIIMNSNGLKLSQKSNNYYYAGACVAKQDEQMKSGFDIILDNDFNKVDIKALAAKIGKDTVDQLGGEACDTGVYKAVLAPHVVSSLLHAYLSNISAEEVQKKSSLFIGKLGEKIASSKLTVEDLPLSKTVYARWFDDEGVATYNKALIKNGVLQTYLYDLTTASKEGKQSTGNGFGAGKKHPHTEFVSVKPGKKSQEQLFEEVEEGVYITEVSGLHAGLNAQSGNFSLQSSGYLIKNGKRDRGLDIITISGNLMDIFKDVISVGNDLELFTSGTLCPSLLIKKITVSGK